MAINGPRVRVAFDDGSDSLADVSSENPLPVTNTGGNPQLPDALTASGNLPVAVEETALPAVITRSNRIAAADGAQTDLALLSVSAGTRIVLTRLTVKLGNATSVNVACTVGFGTANTPTPAKTGTAGIVFDDGGLGAGQGVNIGDGSGVIGIGADNEDLRLTCGAPTGGNLTVSYSYYTIAA